MSAEAVAWVFRHSPLRSPLFAVHVAIADSVNDQHGHELWMRLDQLSTKARVSRSTTQRAVTTMIETGLLALCDGESREGASRAVRYRFCFPDADVAFDSRRVVRETDQGGLRDHPRVVRGTTPRNTTQEREPKKNERARSAGAEPQPELPLPNLFDEFWAAYPRKAGKGQARNAWSRAVRRGDPGEIIRGAERYRDDPNREDRFTKHASTWLNGECWDDEPLPSRTGRRAQRPPDALPRDGAAEVLDL